jgi:hypothetical protein
MNLDKLNKLTDEQYWTHPTVRKTWSDTYTLQEVTDMAKKEMAEAFAFAPKTLVRKKYGRMLRPE